DFHVTGVQTCALPILFRTSYGAYLSAGTATAVEKIGAVRFKSADTSACRHDQLLQHCAAVRVNPAYVTFVCLPGAMPEFVVDPRSEERRVGERRGARW